MKAFTSTNSVLTYSSVCIILLYAIQSLNLAFSRVYTAILIDMIDEIVGLNKYYGKNLIDCSVHLFKNYFWIVDVACSILLTLPGKVMLT